MLDQFEAASNPGDVVEALAKIAHSRDLGFLGAWRPPPRKCDWNAYQLGSNVFWGNDVPTKHLDEFVALNRERGPSIMTQLGWLHNATPFTFTEAMQQLRPTGRDRWIFDFHYDRGCRDALYVATNRWKVLFFSSKKLELSNGNRALLSGAASIAAVRLEGFNTIPPQPRLSGELSPRAIEVLRLASTGLTVRAIGAELGIEPTTVKDHLEHVRKALHAKNTTHAVAEAMRANLLA